MATIINSIRVFVQSLYSQGIDISVAKLYGESKPAISIIIRGIDIKQLGD